MQVALPHQLGRDEVRRRLKASNSSLENAVPGGMAQMHVDWPSEDRMNLTIVAMGQNLGGHIDIEDSQVLIEMNLPQELAFLEPMIAGGIRQQADRMLAPPPADED